MKKAGVGLLTVVALLVGVGLGVMGHYYFKVKLPEMHNATVMRETQERLNKMVRSGHVMQVEPSKITMKVESSGDPSVEPGSVLTLATDRNTIFQEGNEIQNKIGETVDARKYLKPEMQIDIMEKDGRALAIHWTIR